MNQDLSTLMANLAMLQIEVEKLEFRWQQSKAKAQPGKSYVQRLWQGVKAILGRPVKPLKI